MTNGKAKGSGFEREVAKTLTKWLTGQVKPYAFWRSPSSGALTTISEAVDVSGDIIAIRPEGKVLTDKFSIEVKVGYPDVDLLKHFKNLKNDTVESFWTQCVEDAVKSNKSPMLIYKRNNTPTVVGISCRLHNELKMVVDLPKYITICFGNRLPNLVLMNFNEFFKTVTPDILGIL